MRSVKSVGSINQTGRMQLSNSKMQQTNHQDPTYQHQRGFLQTDNPHQNLQALQNGYTSVHNNNNINQGDSNVISNSSQPPTTSPICRCRVMYLGSSVPHITKDGLQGIQEPLKVLYPDKTTLESGNAGIDSWLSVWSNGILIENVDERGKQVKKFFKIDALHYCAAVKYVPLASHQSNYNPYTTLPNQNSLARIPKFLPLDSPHARQPNHNPPIFASIIRRTTGIKVLECHAFICKREAAANALVRCCFHAYADTMYAKKIGADLNGASSELNSQTMDPTRSEETRSSPQYANGLQQPGRQILNQGNAMRRAKSIGNIGEPEGKSNQSLKSSDDQQDGFSMPNRSKSINESILTSSDHNNNLNNIKIQNQQRFSKSFHQLNDLNDNLIQHVNQQTYHNPYASRVPSYPPQNLIGNTVTNGGTLRSIKSMAANSIASTLLRSKKHAKAMSMAQLNQEKLIAEQMQQHNLFNLPPMPPLFLPNMANRNILNGSQTMKPIGSNRSRLTTPNFEAISHKDMKKLLKKNAKYGLDLAKMQENGLPILPLTNCQIPGPMYPGMPINKSGTMMTSTSIYSDMYGPPPPPPPHMLGPNLQISCPPRTSLSGPSIPNSPDHNQVKQILVKPSSEFLKSKAGKKWLKQQKQFKKLLPPHLEGLPIVFGPPPVEALEAASVVGMNGPNLNVQFPQMISPQVPMPIIDSANYFESNGMYQTGRASAASTLLRFSPHTQNLQNHINQDLINHDLGIGYKMQQQVGPMMHDMHYLPHRIQMSHMKLDNGSTMNGSNGPSELIYTPKKHAINPKQRNQMVEQSVISLGDENDYDEEDFDAPSGHYPDYYSSTNTQPSNSSNSDFRYSYEGIQNGNSSRQPTVMNRNHIQNLETNSNNYNNDKGHYDLQPTYSQLNQNNDDQSSYTSEGFRQNQIPGQSFSYSARQVHKSHNQPDYARLESDNNNIRIQKNIDQSEDYYHTVANQNQDQIDEVTSRLESEMSLKSFAHSKMKSQVM